MASQTIRSNSSPEGSKVRKSSVGLLKGMIQQRSLFVLALPGAVLLFLFSYLPLLGLFIAFKDFKYGPGILGSPWQKPIYNNFIFLFTSDGTFRATRNTILINALFISVGVVTAILLAILLNEITHLKFKKIVQSFTFLPYFMSWIVVSVFVYGIFSNETGAVNGLLVKLGAEKIDWYSTAWYWPFILMGVNIWKFSGYNAVIYLATIASVDTTYYEAAQIDGASRFQQILSITIPMLIPTAIVLTLLQVGRIMNADFGMFYGIIGDNPMLFPTTDVLDTFIYRNLKKLGDVGMASAAGFYQSVISFVVLMVCNTLARKYEKGSSLF